MLDARCWYTELLHCRDKACPHGLPFLACAQIQLANQLPQALKLEKVLVVVIALDNFLLMGGEIRHNFLCRFGLVVWEIMILAEQRPQPLDADQYFFDCTCAHRDVSNFSSGPRFFSVQV